MIDSQSQMIRMVDLHAKVVSTLAGAGEGHHIRIPHTCAFDRSPTATATADFESELLFTMHDCIQRLTVTGPDTGRMVVVWDIDDKRVAEEGYLFRDADLLAPRGLAVSQRPEVGGWIRQSSTIQSHFRCSGGRSRALCICQS